MKAGFSVVAVPRLALIACAVLVAADDATARDYPVDPTGAGGAYTSIGAALNAIAGQGSGSRANVLISPGVYNEVLEITKPWVSLVGLGQGPEDVQIVGGGQGIGEPGVYVKGQATGFMATNLTFENPLPDHVSQGLAIRSSADRSAYKRVHFLGYQDTILVDNNSRQYFQDVFITGDTDFIFGNATAVFDRSVIQSTDGGYVTAASTERYTANGLVFLDSELVKGTARSGAPPSTATTNEVYLGRPWQWDHGKSSSTIFVRTTMDSHIRPEGWNDWGSTAPDEVSRYSEFGSVSSDGIPFPPDRSGLPLGREFWADPMTAEQADNYTLEKIFGPVSFWNENPQAQPEFTGPYTTHASSSPWNPLASLAQLPNTLLGDFNSDGRVDAADYTVWRDLRGTGTYLPNSVDTPMAVDEADLQAWQAHYEGALPAGSELATPEPTTSVLGGLSGVIAVAVRARSGERREAAAAPEALAPD